jgi:aspartyl protease family protein
MKLVLSCSKSLLLMIGMLTSQISAAETQINIVGLFTNKAVLIINAGKPKILTVGQSVDGVKLLAADSKLATLQVEGKTRQLGLGQAATLASSATSAAISVTLYADAQGHFYSDCVINGASLRFLVDTGATTVALNSGDAKFASIDYKRGKLVQVGTANGVVAAYSTTIASLKIGSVTLNQVEVTVVEGGSPSIVLLGMSALNRLDMKQHDIALTLTKKY